MRRIIIGVSGASGSLYGYMVLQALRAIGGIETHLVPMSTCQLLC
jgi:flavin prenyltransferase